MALREVVGNGMERHSCEHHGRLLCLLCIATSIAGAAFDTVDHNILLSVFSTRFCVDGTALDWFKSYLNDKSAVIHLQWTRD